MPGSIEEDRLGPAGGIATEIERLRLREREDVVVRLVVVREVHRRARDNREHVRHERLVALIHPRARLVARVERRARRRIEIDHAPPAIGRIVRRRDSRPPTSGRRSVDAEISRTSIRPRIVPATAGDALPLVAVAWPARPSTSIAIPTIAPPALIVKTRTRSRRRQTCAAGRALHRASSAEPPHEASGCAARTSRRRPRCG